jgi:hypothetical protein
MGVLGISKLKVAHLCDIVSIKRTGCGDLPVEAQLNRTISLKPVMNEAVLRTNFPVVGELDALFERGPCDKLETRPGTASAEAYAHEGEKAGGALGSRAKGNRQCVHPFQA